MEGIEAELVHLIRIKQDRWPLAQNEIHFNNEYMEARDKAKDIYDILASL